LRVVVVVKSWEVGKKFGKFERMFEMLEMMM
jgi:hypothetical protein